MLCKNVDILTHDSRLNLLTSMLCNPESKKYSSRLTVVGMHIIPCIFLEAMIYCTVLISQRFQRICIRLLMRDPLAITLQTRLAMEE